MRFKCLNCGDTKYTMFKGKYVCDRCGNAVTEDDLEDNAKKEEEFYKKAMSFLEESYKDSSSDNDLNSLLKQMATIKKTIEELNVYMHNGLTSNKEQLEAIKQELQEQHELINERLPIKEALSEENRKQYEGVSADRFLEEATDRNFIDHAAFSIRREVEQKLIKNFNIPHIGDKFCLKESDYKSTFPNKKIYPTKYVANVKIDNEKVLSLTPHERFICAKFSIDEADKMARYWGETNWFIHDSIETEAEINKQKWSKSIDTMKEHFKKVVAYFRERKLMD